MISGFLISGLLIREYEKTGTLSFTSFYRRTFKRIAPAATAVLAAAVGASALLHNAGRVQQTFWDAVWAFFFAGNWRFASSGTDYFQASGPVSPLQHYWSLAIEEQFNFVWPWLMLLVLWIGSRAGGWSQRTALRWLGAVMSALVIASFSWANYESLNSLASSPCRYLQST